MEYQGPDKRRAKRLRRPFVLRLQRADGSAGNEWSFIFLDNISKSGLSFLSSDKFQEGELFRLKLNVNRDTGTIACVGEVVRVKQSGSGTQSEIAIVFVDISVEGAEAIHKAVMDYDPASGT
jgi:hypothetical protein